MKQTPPKRAVAGEESAQGIGSEKPSWDVITI